MSNLCPNPALANNDTGWTNGTRTAVTGFDRGFAKRYTGNTATFFIGGPQITVTAGQQMTFSYSGRCSAEMTARLYVDYFANGSMSGDSGLKNHALTANVVSRGFQTVTIPSGITGAMFSIYFNLPTTGATFDVTMMRYCVGTDSTYYDGASPGWEWTGTAGDSTSIESAPQVEMSGAKMWNGSAWVDTPKQKYYNGSSWV